MNRRQRRAHGERGPKLLGVLEDPDGLEVVMFAGVHGDGDDVRQAMRDQCPICQDH